MSDPVLVLMDRELAGSGHQATERGGRLRVGRDAERQRILLRRRGRAEKSEVTSAFVHRFTAMDTVVSIQIVGHDSTDDERNDREATAARAAEWFAEIERACSRFDVNSEISKL